MLSPAGSLEALKTAVLYGANAVYIGGMEYGLRAKAKNFTREQMQEGIDFAHTRGVRVHVAVNIIAHNRHFEGLAEHLQELEAMGADAIIVADAGILEVARAVVPDMEIHLSTQASATNFRAFQFWHRQGVRRIVAARELTLAEIRQIREQTAEELVMEAFVHGAMCVSISGRCLLSNYFAHQDANLGACVHPCRWKYAVMEESRPGEYFPVQEEEDGTYFFNSKDLCMIEYIPQMVEAGIGSFKIEGRMKTPLYVAMVTKVYREAIDAYMEDPDRYRQQIPYFQGLLSLVSHRGYSTGFYLGAPGPEEQVYHESAYTKSRSFAAKALMYDPRSKRALVEQRGKFSEGETVEILLPKGEPIPFNVEDLRDQEGEPIASAPHAQQTVSLRVPVEIPVGAILMKEVESSR